MTTARTRANERLASSQGVSNFDDIIGSRDVIERIEELRSERTAWIEELQEANHVFDMTPEVDWHNANTEEGCELDALIDLAKQGEDCAPDWNYGETLIRYSYFEEYAQELAEDCGMVDDQATWPHNCIDWERAARELAYDFTHIDFDGVTYLIR